MDRRKFLQRLGIGAAVGAVAVLPKVDLGRAMTDKKYVDGLIKEPSIIKPDSYLEEGGIVWDSSKLDVGQVWSIKMEHTDELFIVDAVIRAKHIVSGYFLGTRHAKDISFTKLFTQGKLIGNAKEEGTIYSPQF